MLCDLLQRAEGMPLVVHLGQQRSPEAVGTDSLKAQIITRLPEGLVCGLGRHVTIKPTGEEIARLG